MQEPPTIRVRGARTHNLKNIDVDLPTGCLIVITGLSGSGKSSLARDTIFAEGQRRYLESVSGRTHQLIRSLPRPDVDEVHGLPPTVSLDQRCGTAPARSTLAVTAEVHDYLRLLYARCGVLHCTSCGNAVQSQTIDDIVRRTQKLPAESRFMILAPLVRERTGAHREILDRVGRHGLVRVRIDGEIRDVADPGELDSSTPHTIEAVVDRLILREGVEQRLRESIALAVRESEDACIVSVRTDANWTDHYFNTRHSCSRCDVSYPELDPGQFSYHSARGACRKCTGLGIEGVVDDSPEITVFAEQPCLACDGNRLNPLSSAVRFAEHTLPEFSRLSVAEAAEEAREWNRRVTADEDTNLLHRAASLAAARKVVPDIVRRLESLEATGLGYLNLDRSTRTLSGGEYQRGRLAACLATDVHGACYLLDEPTSGLHPADTSRLLGNLLDLRDSGATVVLVEHDLDLVRRADHLIEIGPAAGDRGGAVIYDGNPSGLSDDSATGQALQSESAVSTGTYHPEAHNPQITVHDAALHNLQNITVSFPCGRLTCVTGVSGSGKSSLVTGTLYPAVRAAFESDLALRTTLADVRCGSVDGIQNLRRVIFVDGRPVSRQRRSCLATHSGVWNDVRKLFAKTRAARAQGLTAVQFSFNSGKGRCAACKGTGVQEVRMNLLPDVEIPCPECGGERFSSDVQSVRFLGRTASDLLRLRVDEALEVFSEIDSIVRRLQPFQKVGLGYMTLGQPASTYSGGEAQRVRLASELPETDAGPALYVLDEPTRGLHALDVDRLLSILRGFVEKGDTVVVIEHCVQVMRAADWIIDIGPGPASAGGRIVARGTPATLRSQGGTTAAFL